MGRCPSRGQGEGERNDRPPPSEPDWRVSRIRLSSQWVRSFTIIRPFVCRHQGQQPALGKPFIRPAVRRRSQPLPGASAPLFQQDLQSAVSQVFNLRGPQTIRTGRARSDALPDEIWRCGRLQICATWGCGSIPPTRRWLGASHPRLSHWGLSAPSAVEKRSALVLQGR